MGYKGQGFFVKVNEGTFRGPFENLKKARDEARIIGPDLFIYHGMLKKIDDEIYDDSELFLVPKIEK